jgi:hypothetical protein
MTSLSRRLQRLEATSGRLDSLGRQQDEFSRTAGDYIRAVRQYLGEPPEKEMTTCRNQSDIGQLVNQVVAYRIRSLRHYYHQRGSVGECWIGNAPPERRVRSVAGDYEDDWQKSHSAVGTIGNHRHADHHDPQPGSNRTPVRLAREGGDEFHVARSRSPCAAIPEKAR